MSGQGQKTQSDNGVWFVVAGVLIQMLIVSIVMFVLALFDICVISVYSFDLSVDILFVSIGD